VRCTETDDPETDDPETDDPETENNMHPLLIHDWTPDGMARRHTPGVGAHDRRARRPSRAPLRLHSRGTGSWRREVGMWLVEAGLALVVRG
jgi:hypothetical protein